MVLYGRKASDTEVQPDVVNNPGVTSLEPGLNEQYPPNLLALLSEFPTQFSPLNVDSSNIPEPDLPVEQTLVQQSSVNDYQFLSGKNIPHAKPRSREEKTQVKK
ncbi:MAG: hypothetical protein ACQETH_13610 [Candidatus Rifleibacteriota bacterium]